MDLFLKPGRSRDGEALLVRDPITRLPLAPEGEWKELSTFWLRRLRDGDVVRAEPESTAAPQAPAPDPKERRGR